MLRADRDSADTAPRLLDHFVQPVGEKAGEPQRAVSRAKHPLSTAEIKRLVSGASLLLDRYARGLSRVGNAIEHRQRLPPAFRFGPAAQVGGMRHMSKHRQT